MGGPCLGGVVRGRGPPGLPGLAQHLFLPRQQPAPRWPGQPRLCAGEEGQFPAPGGLPPHPSLNNGAVVPSPPPPLHPSMAPHSQSLSSVCPKLCPTRYSPPPHTASMPPAPTTLVVLSALPIPLPPDPGPLSLWLYLSLFLRLCLSVHLCLSAPLSIPPLMSLSCSPALPGVGTSLSSSPPP